MAQMQHINVYAWAHTVQVATSTERLVLTTLAYLLGGQVSGTLVQQAIADSARMNVRTVRRSLAVLSRSGDIRVDSGHGRPTVVELMVNASQNRTHDPVEWDTRSGSTGHTIRLNGTHDPVQPDTRSGLAVAAGATTVSPEYIPPYSPPTAVEDARSLAGQEGHEHRPTDHFATRRSPEPQPKIDTVGADRWFDLSKALSDRTLDRRGRFMGEGLTAAETNTVRGFIERIGIDAVEQLVASMPDRVTKPTAYLAKCVDRYEADQRDADRGRAALLSEPAAPPSRPQPSDDPEVHARTEAAFAEMFRIMGEAS